MPRPQPSTGPPSACVFTLALLRTARSIQTRVRVADHSSPDQTSTYVRTHCHCHREETVHGRRESETGTERHPRWLACWLFARRGFLRIPQSRSARSLARFLPTPRQETRNSRLHACLTKTHLVVAAYSSSSSPKLFSLQLPPHLQTDAQYLRLLPLIIVRPARFSHREEQKQQQHHIYSCSGLA